MKAPLHFSRYYKVKDECDLIFTIIIFSCKGSWFSYAKFKNRTSCRKRHFKVSQLGRLPAVGIRFYNALFKLHFPVKVDLIGIATS